MVVKIYVVLCCFVALAFAGDKYTDKYDNVDVEAILHNARLLASYINCLLDLGPCTPEGKALREHLVDGMETGCEKCTEIQKDKTTSVMKFMIKEKPEIWKKMTDKYDPDGVYRQKYEGLARERGIELPKA